MTIQAQCPPRVFISYSWSSSEYQNKILQIAHRLRENDGIDVIIDVWDLKPGQDNLAYMERMVTADEMNFVLIFSDKKYSEKADLREGGVGTETQILTPEIYTKTDQEKFIPIVMERDNNGNAYLPNYAKSRFYIDLSDSGDFEKGYEQLVRKIWNQPLFKKPEIGLPPKYIFNENKTFFKTTAWVRKINSSLDNRFQNIAFFIGEFFSAFLEELQGMRLPQESNIEEPFDELVFQSINSMVPLRDEFIEVIDRVLAYSLESNLEKALVNFFEALYQLGDLDPENNVMSGRSGGFDNFRFLIRELFLYFATSCFEHEKYEFLSHILGTEFLVYSWKHQNLIYADFSALTGKRIASLNEHRNQRLKANLYSYVADLLLKRCHKRYKKNDLASVDVVLAFLSKTTYSADWWPICGPYVQDILFLRRLKSKRHFEKVKVVFGVNRVDELQNLLRIIKHDTFKLRSFFLDPLTVERFINIDDIASKP